jgi:3-oxoadipate enol-lactonase
MKPALVALAKSCRTISYTLSGDRGSGWPYNPDAGFDNYVRQLDDLFVRTKLARASLCGVSFGGFVALRYAALRPDRVDSLTLVSSPAPGWTPSARQRRYIARPWLSTPAFVLTGPRRLWPEIHAAYPDWRDRGRFAARHLTRVISSPMIPSVMAARVRLEQSMDFGPDCTKVRAATLVITGEEGLDRVVPVDVTKRYLTLLPGARYEKMEGTGHLGLLTRPEEFARKVSAFVRQAHCDQPASQRRG